MLAASDLVKEYKPGEQGETGKLLEIGRFVFSSLSLNLADTACSMAINLIGNAIEKRIHIAKWDKQIEQCIRAADAALMSAEEISILKDTVKEKLNGSYIDVQKLLRDEKYLKKLASNIAGYDEDTESERLTRVFEYLLQILLETLRKSPQFLGALHVIVTEHEHLLEKHEIDIESLKEEVKELKIAPCDVQEFLKKLPALRVSNGKPFAYNNNRLQEVYGRDIHLSKLSAFADDRRRFLFWVVTGPAGIGKSKLVFCFGRLYQKKGWIVRDLDRTSIQELCNMNNWDISKDIILIIDYANEQEKIATLLSKLCWLKENDKCGKIRVILLAREGAVQSAYDPQQTEYPQWYIDLIKEISTANNFLYLQEFMDLHGLSIEECNNLHKSYAENYLLREAFEKDKEIVQQLIEKEVLDDEGFARPLYALFVIDSYYNAPKSRIWDLDSLQKQIYERDWDNWKKEISGKANKREKVFISFANVLIYATVFGKWESDTVLPEPLSVDCKSINNAALLYSTDYKSKCFKLLTGRSYIDRGSPVLVRLTPDMVGEYYVMKRLSIFDNETLHSWAILMAVKLIDCKDFFVRAIQDFSNHPSFVFTFLKLLNVISQKVDDCGEETHKAFSSILETFFRNYKGNEDDKVFREIFCLTNGYVAKYRNIYVCAAELALLFHENKPHIGISARIRHFEQIEVLYTRWPNSHKIVSSYISFLGDIVASRIGAHTPEYNDSFISKFLKLSNWAESTDYGIQKAFIPVLLKNIERANNVHDWERSSLFEDQFLKKVINQCADELLMDCIGKYDSVIISLAKEKAKVINTTDANSMLEDKELIVKIDLRLKKAIAFFKYIIDNNTDPSVNFIWTYVGKLAMITKNLFINQCSPHNELLFQYMIDNLQKVYNEYYYSNEDSFLAWRVSRAIDVFCDSKSGDIPYYLKAQCILKTPSAPRSFDEKIE